MFINKDPGVTNPVPPAAGILVPHAVDHVVGYAVDRCSRWNFSKMHGIDHSLDSLE